jgi:hypothetical protein
MKSVADDLSRDLDRELRVLSPGERISLSLALGAEAVRLYAQSHDVSADEARRILQRNNRAGRRPSAVMEAADKGSDKPAKEDDT